MYYSYINTVIYDMICLKPNYYIFLIKCIIINILLIILKKY